MDPASGLTFNTTPLLTLLSSYVKLVLRDPSSISPGDKFVVAVDEGSVFYLDFVDEFRRNMYNEYRSRTDGRGKRIVGSLPR